MNHFRVVVLFLTVALLGGCGTVAKIPSQAQPKNQPQVLTGSVVGDLDPSNITWHIRDEWIYSDDYTLRVDRVDGTVGKLTRINRGWIEREGLFKIRSNTDGIVRQVIFRSPDPASLFPLKVGNKVTYKREYLMGKIGANLVSGPDLSNLKDKQLRVHKSSWTVTGKERVSVPAGTFDCWILEWNTLSELSGWKGSEKWWYSPEVGNYVRMEFKYGKKPASSRVLMKYTKGEEL
jgi:hypothetical protein